MVDGRGRARIMDFGLAVAVDEGADANTGGTLAYMAPEQFGGKGASVRSDLYALGLVLYELYTGKRGVRCAISVADYGRKHAEEPPTSPSAIVEGDGSGGGARDPALHREGSRAASVLGRSGGGGAAGRRSARGRARGGGDALPRDGRGGGERGPIQPGLARACSSAVASALARVCSALVGKTHLLAAVDSQKSPDVLRARAREILDEPRNARRPADWAADVFEIDDLRRLGQRSTTPPPIGGRRGIARDAIDYRYRQSPTMLVRRVLGAPFPGPRVSPEFDPAPVQSGDVHDAARRGGPTQVSLGRAAGAREGVTDRSPSPTGQPLFRAAGLDIEPVHAGRAALDSRRLRRHARRVGGAASRAPGLTMRVEAAAYRGRPVSFRWLGPWTQPDATSSTRATPGARGRPHLRMLILLVLLLRRALARSREPASRSGRPPRRDASGGAPSFVCDLGAWAFGAHHVSSRCEFELIFANGLANAFVIGSVRLDPLPRGRSRSRAGTGPTC